jgi:hypothetical protein
MRDIGGVEMPEYFAKLVREREQQTNVVTDDKSAGRG